MKLRAEVTGLPDSFPWTRQELAGGRLFPPAVTLELSPAEGGWSLIRTDERDQFAGDTWHPTLEQAQRQAEFEYGLTAAEWRELHAVAGWRRLDLPGRDRCELWTNAAGAELRGEATWGAGPRQNSLRYTLRCDAAYHAIEGAVKGVANGAAVELHFQRTPSGWLRNGVWVPGLEDCVDLDYSFTPATNWPHLRRTHLAVGQSALVPAAWWNADDDSFTRLPQRYERRSTTEVKYEAPTLGYSALLIYNAEGFVRRYPELWEAEEYSV